MHLPVMRLFRIAAVVTVVAFVTAGILRNTHHGAGQVVGDVAWFTFLGALLFVILFGLSAGARAGALAVRRRASRQ